jgi:hypothetical protein
LRSTRNAKADAITKAIKRDGDDDDNNTHTHTHTRKVVTDSFGTHTNAPRYGQIVELYDVCEAHRSHGKAAAAGAAAAAAAGASDSSVTATTTAAVNHGHAKTTSGAGAGGDRGRGGGGGGGGGERLLSETRPDICAAMASDVATRDSFTVRGR